MTGATKLGEYARTVEILVDKTGKTKHDIMYILYFLADSQYSAKELKEMANLLRDKKL